METEAQLKTAMAKMDALRRQLLNAKGRQKAITTKERLMREVSVRKEDEESALETTLAMRAKVSGKPDVMS